MNDELAVRHELLADQLQQLEERVDDEGRHVDRIEVRVQRLEDAQCERGARRREWLVIWLIVAELLMLVPIAPSFLRWVWRAVGHA